MFPLYKCLAVIAATIIATSQTLHLTSYFPQDICIQRSSVDHLYSLPPASVFLISEFRLTIVTELDRIIHGTHDTLRMREADILQRRVILSDLQHDLLGRNLSLEAFGSCCNGFGTVASDLDVKITVRLAVITAEMFGYEADIEIQGNITRSEMVQLLSKEFTVTHVSKHLPIIMLKHLLTGFKVDGSVNPTNQPKTGLGIWLLREYSRFDARVQVLGVFLKAVVKNLKISETTFGDLGSSVYITMLIHYLQPETGPVRDARGLSRPDPCPRARAGPYRKNLINGHASDARHTNGHATGAREN